MLVASTPETTNPVSTQCEIEGRALHLHRRAVAALLHRPPAESRRSEVLEAVRLAPSTSSGASRTSSRSSPTCGASCRPTSRSAALFPNDGDGNAWGDKVVGFPPVLDEARLQAHRSRPLSGSDRRFLRADRRVQQEQRRDRHGRGDPARLHDLLEPGQPEGFQAEDRLDRQGDPVPGRARCARQVRPTTCLAKSGGRRPIPFKSSLTGVSAGDLAKAYTQATGKPWTQQLGFVHALFEVAADVLKRSADPSDPKANVAAISKTNLDTIVGQVAFGNDPSCRPSRSKNIAKTPLVGGQWRLGGDGKYELIDRRQPDAPRDPDRAASWNRSPDLARRSVSAPDGRASLRLEEILEKSFGACASPTTSRSPSRRARRSASSVRTAPARRRCSA